MTDNIVLQCPQCKKPVPWNEEHPHRPFCSARCQRLDFGDWANEEYRIAGEPARDEFSEKEGSEE
ncbi:MAG TPA: DNA gyrase inhibitor YacG [Porticoccaceae bacterium]|nr:DNA gyrase inhibitor YacG [Porticoccaceae bacterium]